MDSALVSFVSVLASLAGIGTIAWVLWLRVRDRLPTTAERTAVRARALAADYRASLGSGAADAPRARLRLVRAREDKAGWHLLVVNDGGPVHELRGRAGVTVERATPLWARGQGALLHVPREAARSEGGPVSLELGYLASDGRPVADRYLFEADAGTLTPHP